MKYKFLLSYTPTEGTALPPVEVHPNYSDALTIAIDKASNEWYYTRKLDGTLTFLRSDYAFIMSCPLDGTFTLTIEENHSSPDNWHKYFSGTFSRANLSIDEDHHSAVLNGITEGIYNVLDNAKNDEYDLRKLIPDTELREVQSTIPPALAIIDFRSESITFSDIFSGGPAVAGGFNGKSGFDIDVNTSSDNLWSLQGIYVEAKVVMLDQSSPANGIYAGTMQYRGFSNYDYNVMAVAGRIYNANGYSIQLETVIHYNGNVDEDLILFDPSSSQVSAQVISTTRTLPDEYDILNPPYYSPSSLIFQNTASVGHDNITIYFHYIRTALITAFEMPYANPLDTGPYYKYIIPFEGSGLTVTQSTNTVDQPNGHRLISGSYNLYFAPPDNSGWIPLAEDNWNYASLWYKVIPSTQNGLLNPAFSSTFRFPYCFTLGTCLKYLLDRVSSHVVQFDEAAILSHFLYDPLNPLTGGENFSYLITQKSNVMHPAASGASTCKVTLQWFFELLRNAFNCYYWLEPTNIGTYYFHVEHVEYLRRGGRYNGSLAARPDLTALRPQHNFTRLATPVKTYADLTNKYEFNLDNMAEKYTFAWQGDGGGDDFKGHPMLFRAGWVNPGSSESHEVDNIFADLSWLMLNAGTDTESARNFDGIFLFGTYRYAAVNDPWRENSAPLARVLSIAEGNHISAFLNIILTIPQGSQVSVHLDYNVTTYTGTGSTQAIPIAVDELFISGFHQLFVNFGDNWQQVVIHRIHALNGNVYNVATVANQLRPGTYLSNGALAWPYLQSQFLHYDIPAQKWSLNTDNPDLAEYQPTGTVKMVKRQSVGTYPCPTDDPDTSQGVKTGLGIGVIEQAHINLSSRNAELTIIYDPIPDNQ